MAPAAARSQARSGDPSRAPAFGAVIFDMDGVVTRTAALHAAAWKSLFDAYLEERRQRGESGFAPFDAGADYLALVDGKPRHAGVEAFLAARGIHLPEGCPDDAPQSLTVCGLGNRKDSLFEAHLRTEGVKVYESTLVLIRQLRRAGVRIGLVTSSRHGRAVLQLAGIASDFDAVLDGNDRARLNLPGKPDPAMFCAAADALGVDAPRAVVVEDAAAGVEAACSGGFGLVIGVDRGGNRDGLLRAGADQVVADLAEIDLARLDAVFRRRTGEREAQLSAEATWQVEHEGFDPAHEHELESLFTVGNGFLGVRGALDTPMPNSQADLFVAGIYDRKQRSLPYSELEFLTPDRDDYAYSEIVSLPFPFVVRMAVDGRPLDVMNAPWRLHRRTLDLKRGRLLRLSRFEDSQGRSTRVETMRLASLADPGLLLQEIRVTCENHDAEVTLVPAIEETDLDFRHPHLQAVAAPVEAGLGLRIYRTRASAYTVAIAWRCSVAALSRENPSVDAAAPFAITATAGAPVILRRWISVRTSRDEDDPAAAAAAAVRTSSWADFDADVSAHEARWREYWAQAGMHVDGDAAALQALRFNAYHLRIAASLDPRVSIGARTLSGRGYEGHVFWDVETFMLPMFVHTEPRIARSLLEYRHCTLDGARQRARELGYRGACYAWESTVTGADTTPRSIYLRTSERRIPIYTGFQQVHVTADIAAAVWQYFDRTHDDAFLLEHGAEILIETARFWISRSEAGPRHHHIRKVTGPDEYHHSVDDNAYTNWMARFNLERAAWVADWLRERHPQRWDALAALLGVGRDEADAWQRLAQQLYCPQPRADGVIEQFTGYFDLAEYALPESDRFKPPLARLFDAEAVNRSKLIKQADVLMLMFLFPEQFARDTLAANYAYYEPRTDHGSSLSPPVHAALAARLGLREDARRYWRRSLWLDLSNTMGNSALGIHAASMAGCWQALVFGFLGVSIGEAGPRVAADAGARLPESWQRVALSLRWRGNAWPLHAERMQEKPQ